MSTRLLTYVVLNQKGIPLHVFEYEDLDTYLISPLSVVKDFVEECEDAMSLTIVCGDTRYFLTGPSYFSPDGIAEWHSSPLEDKVVTHFASGHKESKLQQWSELEDRKVHEHDWRDSNEIFVGVLYPSIYPFHCECGAFRREDDTILNPIAKSPKLDSAD